MLAKKSNRKQVEPDQEKGHVSSNRQGHRGTAAQYNCVLCHLITRVSQMPDEQLRN
jgi:hypothetical protein